MRDRRRRHFSARREGRALAWAVLLLSGPGCTGDLTGGAPDEQDGDDAAEDGGGGGGMPSERSLNRNPDHPLVCDRPADLNVAITAVSRLTHAQYRRSLRDLVAPVLLEDELFYGLPPETADKHGFVNNWDSQTTEAKLVEQYELTARKVAAKVAAALPSLGIDACTAPQGSAEESACGAAFVDGFAPRAYRRPLQEEEAKRLRLLFENAHQEWGLPDAIKVVTSALLSSPQFIYRLEGGAEDARGTKLTGHEVASRLSFLIWGSMPDAELFAQADAGELEDEEGIERATRRLLTSERAKEGLSDFAAQWLRYSKLASAIPANRKDRTRFPQYSDETAEAASAGLRMFVDDALLGEGGGIHKLLTSRKAWVNEASAWVYGDSVSASGGELREVELDGEQRRGFLTQFGTLAGFAHETLQSPVQRGVFILEQLLCSPPPPPPPNVAPAPAAEATDVETNRQKFVRQHENQPACKSCHERLDGVGFAFESYDAIGRWQTHETVAGGKALPVDSSGAISGTFDADGEFANALEMIDKLATSEQVAQCAVENFYRYALARDVVDEDGCALAETTDHVVAAQGSLEALLIAAVNSNQFRYRAPLLP